MKYANLIPGESTVAYTFAKPDEPITTLRCACGNTVAASFWVKYVTKGGGSFFLTPKLFTPPPGSVWDYFEKGGSALRGQPGDSLVVSASDAANYDLLLD